MSKKIIFTNGLIDLAQPRLGTKVIFKTDDFFASANRIILIPSQQFLKMDCLIKMENGWMDGNLEGKRTSGHDYIILKLGKPGSIKRLMLIHRTLMETSQQ